MAIQFELVRPEDLLNLLVRGENLRLNGDDPKYPVLEVENSEKPAFLILTFPPQTIAERAYFEAPIVVIGQDPQSGVPPDPDTFPPDGSPPVNDPPLDAPGFANSDRPVVAMLGRTSRLVFKVPAGHTIPYSVAGILDWTGLELSVNPIAAIGREPSDEEIAGAPGIREPESTETALELPYRLVISPTAGVAWDHRAAPFTHRGRTELWHTRMQLLGEDGEAQELSRTNTASMRAIWSPDYKPLNPPPPAAEDPQLGRTAMAPNDRHQIVILTSAFHGFLVDKTIDINLPDIDLPLGPENAAVGIHVDQMLGNVTDALPYRGSFKITVPYVPEPFEARQVMLSPLGGWLKSRGQWDPPYPAPPRRGPTFPPIDLPFELPFDLDDIFGERVPGRGEGRGRLPAAFGPLSPVGNIDDIIINPDIQFNRQGPLDLSEWVHIASQGRDHYVRIVYEGELWPGRHRAALVKVTERKFKEVGNIIGAYMIQRMFIVVREPEKAFNNRGLPFKKVRLTTLVTPDIAPPEIFTGTSRSFWVKVYTSATSQALFRFHAVVTDVAAKESDATIPMMFVSISDLPVTNAMKKVAAAYNAKAMFTEREINIPGQKVTFAARHSDPNLATDNTELVTESINLVVDAAGTPPQMLKAAVKIPQVNELLGTDQATDIRFFQGYLEDGFDAANGVFAEIVKVNDGLYSDDNPFAGIEPNTLAATFQSNQAGGFATPNMALSTLTRELGPVAGKAADALLDAFNPADFFGDGLAFLFGSFDLSSLIPGGPLGQNGPKFTTKTVDIPGGQKLMACFDWKPPLQDVDLIVAEFKKDYENPSEFVIAGCMEKEIKLDGSLAAEPTFDMNGKLTNFQVIILKSVTINFTEFAFESHSGQKTDVKVKLDPDKPLAFGGDLEFVEELRNAIPPDLFGDGPSLDIGPTGITAGFAFALPPIAVGVFALKDVSLGAALTLPFLDGKPVFDFNVSTRERPFLLSVSIFGGGGFFRLQLDTMGMKMLEAAFEFGVTCALDLGVASGEVHVMAGIYFALERKEESDPELSAVLSGYLRMGGSLSVLGLIKVSVEFNLSFTYDSNTGKAYGRATLTVEVEVLFFSASVELTVERAFGGESGDPKFGEMYDTAEKWSRYALAFA